MEVKWFRSESALQKFLASKGLTGKSGRIYNKSGIPLRLDRGYYGQYSPQSWFVRLTKEAINVRASA
jgi:hypothetical protein